MSVRRAREMKQTGVTAEEFVSIFCEVISTHSLNQFNSLFLNLFVFVLMEEMSC